MQQLREGIYRRVRAASLAIGRVAASLGAAVARGAAQLAYRRHEAAVVALLGTGVLGGFAVVAWRRQEPAVLERLEREPPRLALPSPPPRGASRPPSPRARAPAEPVRPPADPARTPERQAAPTPDAPLDLNRATAADLTRLPGVGPRLAERILARRDAQGGRFGSVDDLAGVPGLGTRKATRLRPLVTAQPDTTGASSASDTAEAREPP